MSQLQKDTRPGGSGEWPGKGVHLRHQLGRKRRHAGTVPEHQRGTAGGGGPGESHQPDRGPGLLRDRGPGGGLCAAGQGKPGAGVHPRAQGVPGEKGDGDVR